MRTDSARRKLRVVHLATTDMSIRHLLLAQLEYLASVGYEVSAICADGPWVSEVRARGVRVDTVPLTRRITPATDLRALTALIALLRRTRPDIIHTHTPKASLLGQWAGAMARVPHRVHTIHGLYVPTHRTQRRLWPYLLLERLQMTPAHLVLSQNHEDLLTCQRYHLCDPRRLRFLGNGIDLDAFDPRQTSAARIEATRSRLGIPAGNVVVGMVGRLVREKGYLEYFAAAQQILRERSDVTFLAIGPSEPEKADAVAATAASHLGDSMRFLGHRDDMPELYAAMDLLVLPSHREGFPRAPMEAAASARAVIATDIRGCRETVVDGRTGLLVPPRDPGALADAIRLLLSDTARRAAMATEGRKLAEERFDQRIVFARVAQAYAEIT